MKTNETKLLLQAANILDSLGKTKLADQIDRLISLAKLDEKLLDVFNPKTFYIMTREILKQQSYTDLEKTKVADKFLASLAELGSSCASGPDKEFLLDKLVILGIDPAKKSLLVQALNFISAHLKDFLQKLGRKHVASEILKDRIEKINLLSVLLS